MQYAKLKRQLAVEAGIIAGVMLTLGAIIYLLSSVEDDYTASNEALQRKVDAVDLEMNTLRGRFNNIKKNMDIYEEVQKKQQDGSLGINRQIMLEKFNQFKTAYSLNGLRLSVGQPQEVKDAIFKRKNSTVHFSEVYASFDVVSDEGIYHLVDSLREELPGISKLVKFTLVMQSQFNDDVYKEISEHGSYPLIKADIKFVWFGINYTPPGTAPADNGDNKKDGSPSAPRN
jgi:hypothetical protein